jgi:hypothetical protein
VGCFLPLRFPTLALNFEVSLKFPLKPVHALPQNRFHVISAADRKHAWKWNAGSAATHHLPHHFV